MALPPNRSSASKRKTGTLSSTHSAKSTYYPASLNVQGKRCIVVGDGAEAADRRANLKAAGARVTLYPARTKNLLHVAEKNRPFLIIYCPQDQPATVKKLASLCRRERILLCAIDQPKYCDVVNVSVYGRGPLKIMISTDGVAPSVARKIRLGLEESLKAAPIEPFMRYLADVRKKVMSSHFNLEERREALLKATEGFSFKALVQLPKGWKK